MVILHTNKGSISLELDHQNAPATAANFLRYANDDFFAGTLFHRVIPNFMVQGGGLLPDLASKPAHPPIKNEANNGLSNTIGSIAMARTNDPHSASSQFFINVADNTFLDHTSPTPQGWGYCVFGRVSAGMDVVEAIVKVPTTSRSGHQDVPVDDIIIERVEVLED
ncbi:MAG: peptidyl-prolyl cis-trans isomerase [Candidatus Competibacteraceae bacterium]|nr:peptidyl-prolyl cis-trans isomerase [Candidatus Competibacteraceae bacterium]